MKMDLLDRLVVNFGLSVGNFQEYFFGPRFKLFIKTRFFDNPVQIF